MEQKKIRLPLIVSDIDGVLSHTQKPLPRVLEALEILNQDLNSVDPQKFQNANTKIPFCCLTNRSQITEALAVQIFNTQCQKELIKENQMILASTPLIQIIKKYQERLILIVSRQHNDHEKQRLHDYMQSTGITKFITAEEYYLLYPKLVPVSANDDKNIVQLQLKTSEEISQRLGIDIETLNSQFIQVHAIFILLRPIQWEQNIQIILDLLSTEDGRIAQKMPEKGPAKHIPVYSAFDDVYYMDAFCLPRMLLKPFNEGLKLLHKELYKTDINLQVFGKPNVKQFQFVEEHAKNNIYDPNTIEISQKYMIGDNPTTDIKGANDAKWVSILVQTGVYAGTENDTLFPGKYFVKDFYEAIKLIYQLEGIEISCDKQ